MNAIKFSHKYPKLKKPDGNFVESAVLLHVFTIDSTEMNAEFIDYDTMFYDDNDAYPCGKYKLPEGTLLVLLFCDDCGDSNFVFTTIRSYRIQKYGYYRSMIGKEFEVQINAS